MATLAQYIADYIRYEIESGTSIEDIDSTLIQNAIDAFNGGAADILSIYENTIV